MIEEYLRVSDVGQGPDAPLFTSIRGKRLTSESLNRILDKIAKRAGFTTRITGYHVRHAVAQALRASGASITVIQQLLRHQKLSNTLIYAQPASSEPVQEMVNSNPLFTKLSDGLRIRMLQPSQEPRWWMME